MAQRVVARAKRRAREDGNTISCPAILAETSVTPAAIAIAPDFSATPRRESAIFQVITFSTDQEDGAAIHTEPI
jgi:hypothetical protein